LNDAIGHLVQQRDAGSIDEAEFEAKARALVGSVSEEVLRATRRINRAAREALRAEGDEREESGEDRS